MLSWKVKNGSVKCTVDATKDEAMEYLTNGVNYVKASMLRVFMESKQDLVQVLHYFFRPESLLYNLFVKEVNEFEDHAMFLRCHKTFLFLDFNDSSSNILLKGIESNNNFSYLIKIHGLPYKSYEEI